MQRLTEIQYCGDSGVSADCLEAIARVLQFGDTIDDARLLSATGRDHCRQHAFLLTINCGVRVAIRSGLTSGYVGEGPRTLAQALALLRSFDVQVEEYEITTAVMNRLNESILTADDLDRLDALRPVRPTRIYDYVDDFGLMNRQDERLWDFFPPVIPFAIVDPRIRDLVIRFWNDPDASLSKGYRRLEDCVRERTQLDEHGTKLFAAAFRGAAQKMTWNGCHENECEGRAQLFIGAFMAFRNRRAHREVIPDSEEHLREFLVLNELFLLERTAITVAISAACSS